LASGKGAVEPSLILYSLTKHTGLATQQQGNNMIIYKPIKKSAIMVHGERGSLNITQFFQSQLKWNIL